MRVRTQGPAESSVAAADNVQVNAGVEEEAALHAKFTEHSGEFSMAAAGEQAGALGGLENISQEASVGAALDAGLPWTPESPPPVLIKATVRPEWLRRGSAARTCR